jgi:hypothetical protein
MIKLGLHRAFAQLCLSMHKWGVYISFDSDDDKEFEKAAPYLDGIRDCQIFADGCGIILCDSQEEMETIFGQTVGDDGPTETNSYNGIARVYALTCSPAGTLLNENT